MIHARCEAFSDQPRVLVYGESGLIPFRTLHAETGSWQSQRTRRQVQGKTEVLWTLDRILVATGLTGIEMNLVEREQVLTRACIDRRFAGRLCMGQCALGISSINDKFRPCFEKICHNQYTEGIVCSGDKIRYRDLDHHTIALECVLLELPFVVELLGLPIPLLNSVQITRRVPAYRLFPSIIIRLDVYCLEHCDLKRFAQHSPLSAFVRRDEKPTVA